MMREFLRNLGFVLSVLCLALGTYLLHDAVSGLGHGGLVGLILGSVLCALALVTGIASIRLQHSLRALKNHVKSSQS